MAAESTWPPILREPFLHFTLIGALIFGGHYAFAKRTQEITVSAQTQAELGALFEQRRQRKPDPQERAELLERYVDDEILFREGLARGFVNQDPAIREQVIARMHSALRGAVSLPEPNEPELEAYYRQHRANYALPAALSFTEYVLPGESEASAHALVQALRAGAPVNRTPRVHRDRSMVQLRTLYGEEVASRMFRLPVGNWEVLRSTQQNLRVLRVLRVEARRESVQRSFEDAKDQVRPDFEQERTRAGIQQALQALRTRFSVNVEGEGREP